MWREINPESVFIELQFDLRRDIFWSLINFWSFLGTPDRQEDLPIFLQSLLQFDMENKRNIYIVDVVKRVLNILDFDSIQLPVALPLLNWIKYQHN